MGIFRPIKIRSKNLRDSVMSRLLIRNYLSKNEKKQRKIILGGHWSDNPDWLILNQFQQDITKKLKFPTNSVNVVFLEHVIEHIDLEDAILFFKEVRRILIKGGQLRLVFPSTEKIIKANLSKSIKNNKNYIKNILINLHYSKINSQLMSIGLKGISEDVNTFFLNSIFGENDHKFITSAMLLKKILLSIGFSKVEIFEPGQGFAKENCIERRQRGIYLGSDWKKDQKKPTFDIESLAVDAVK